MPRLPTGDHLWLSAHPRFVLHFTPTSSSWANLVDRWCGDLTTKKLRRSAQGSYRRATDIKRWIESWNEDPKPYVWAKTADLILESIARYFTTINDSGRTAHSIPMLEKRRWASCLAAFRVDVTTFSTCTSIEWAIS